MFIILTKDNIYPYVIGVEKINKNIKPAIGIKSGTNENVKYNKVVIASLCQCPCILSKVIFLY